MIVGIALEISANRVSRVLGASCGDEAGAFDDAKAHVDRAETEKTGRQASGRRKDVAGGVRGATATWHTGAGLKSVWASGPGATRYEILIYETDGFVG